MESWKTKQQLRHYIALLKKEYAKTTLHNLSERLFDRLEETDFFRKASSIAIYHALPGEVQTSGFIDKWHPYKQLLLPLVVENDLRLLPYKGKEHLQSGPYGILEPLNTDDEAHEKEIDLIIVPGIAFDRSFNRLGRGKGYYDRLLSGLTVPKIGVCFNFQLFDTIPTEPFDKKMDMIVTENEIICK